MHDFRQVVEVDLRDGWLVGLASVLECAADHLRERDARRLAGASELVLVHFPPHGASLAPGVRAKFFTVTEGVVGIEGVVARHAKLGSRAR